MTIKSDNVFSITPIGGLGQIGSNMTLVSGQEESVIIDCGILFPNEDCKSILRDKNFIERLNYRFTWINDNFCDFDNFLSIFTSRQRATIRKERNSINKLGIKIYCKRHDETLPDRALQSFVSDSFVSGSVGFEWRDKCKHRHRYNSE